MVTQNLNRCFFLDTSGLRPNCLHSAYVVKAQPLLSDSSIVLDVKPDSPFSVFRKEKATSYPGFTHPSSFIHYHYTTIKTTLINDIPSYFYKSSFPSLSLPDMLCDPTDVIWK